MANTESRNQRIERQMHAAHEALLTLIFMGAHVETARHPGVEHTCARRPISYLLLETYEDNTPPTVVGPFETAEAAWEYRRVLAHEQVCGDDEPADVEDVLGDPFGYGIMRWTVTELVAPVRS